MEMEVLILMSFAHGLLKGILICLMMMILILIDLIIIDFYTNLYINNSYKLKKLQNKNLKHNLFLIFNLKSNFNFKMSDYDMESKETE